MFADHALRTCREPAARARLYDEARGAVRAAEVLQKQVHAARRDRASPARARAAASRRAQGCGASRAVPARHALGDQHRRRRLVPALRV